MDRKTETPDTPAAEVSPALVAAGLVVAFGALMWINSDVILRPLAAAGYARTTPYTTSVDLTPAGWLAVCVLGLGVLALVGAAVLAWILVDGMRDGWASRAVPVVPPEAVQVAAGMLAAAVTLAVTVAVDLPAWMGLPVAVIGGAGIGWASRDAATPWVVRALAVDALDRTCGWPRPGQSRIRRIKISAEQLVTYLAISTGPNFDARTSLPAAVDRAAQCPALAGLTFSHDSRRRLLIGEFE